MDITRNFKIKSEQRIALLEAKHETRKNLSILLKGASGEKELPIVLDIKLSVVYTISILNFHNMAKLSYLLRSFFHISMPQF